MLFGDELVSVGKNKFSVMVDWGKFMGIGWMFSMSRGWRKKVWWFGRNPWRSCLKEFSIVRKGDETTASAKFYPDATIEAKWWVALWVKRRLTRNDEVRFS